MLRLSNKLAKVAAKFTLAIVMVSALILATIPGCTEEEAEPVHLKVAVLPYITFATFYIALDEGYFAEQGLDVEMVKFTSVTQAMPLLSQGDLDVAGGPMSASLFNAIGQDVNIKIVAGKEYNTTEGEHASLMVRKDLYDSGELDSIPEMKGRQVAIASLANIQHFQLAKILETGNLTLDDVTIVKMGPADVLAAFENGAIEAALIGDPYNAQIKDLGYAVTLISFEKVVPTFQIGYIMYGPSLLEGNQETGKKFMVAYLKGARQFAQGKTERNLEILEDFLGIDRETLLEIGWNRIRLDGLMPVEDIMAFQDWAYENGFVDQKVSAEQLVDTTFIDYANSVLGPATETPFG